MSNDLRPVWQQVEVLLNEGINVIPVRDREEVYQGRILAKKTPYKQWQKYQLEIIDRQELFHMMERFNTTAVAMVCGAISGNLEVIDVDVKYHPGIDARLFGDLQAIYPDLLERLRVHKSPSGGCHIIYRIEPGHEVPGSMHLAVRAATEEEIAKNPKRNTYCFIETRGEGGLCTAPPSMGYIIRKPAPIPVLSWEERCTLIELCRSYNLYIKEEKPYKPNKAEANYYDENPFEHYNRTVDAQELLTNCGWTFVAHRGNFLRFTKPGGKKGDVHGSFDTEKRVFFVFSSNADLEGEHAYNPATVLAHYSFAGDKQRTYQWLVEAGYGQIKPIVEKRIIQRAAIAGNDLPANVSQSAKVEYEETVAKIHERHPHGIFWEFDDDEVKISRERLYAVAEGLGFRYHKSNDEVVQIIEQFIHKRDDREFYDTLKHYIHDDDGDLLEDICNAYEAFIEKHGKFTMRRLAILDPSLILHDTRDTCYKFYQNGYVSITATDIQLLMYSSLEKNLIWANKVQPRDYCFYNGSCLYTDFLDHAVALDQQRDHIMKCIGYLAHDYKDETTGYFIVLSETCPDPLQGGGTGKNLFCNLLGLTTTYSSVPGSQVQMNEKFLQSWNGQRIFAVSDAKKDFDFSFLKELTSGNALLKKLFKDERIVGLNDLPKFIIQTNFSSDVQDGGVKRRIVQIEFTDFFTRSAGVDKFYGKHFPNDWDEQDFNGYDTFVSQSVQAWLQSGRKLENLPLSSSGWEKQFINTYGQTIYDFIQLYYEEKWKDNFVTNYTFNQQLDAFCIESNIPSKYKPSSQKINRALEEWCRKNNCMFYKDAKLDDVRGRKFQFSSPL